LEQIPSVSLGVYLAVLLLDFEEPQVYFLSCKNLRILSI
jgi:hypothetical protein